MAVGSRAMVWHGTAAHTSGGLHRSDLKMNKYGHIVSRAASAASRRRLASDPALKAAFRENALYLKKHHGKSPSRAMAAKP